MNEEEIKQKLTLPTGRQAPEQYKVMREGGTEAPFSGQYWDAHEPGTYKCAACEQELFSSEAKFESGTGWPSFTDPVNLKNIELQEDSSGGIKRTEVICKNCGSHLGHVFDDGPLLKDDGPPVGKASARRAKRYCINSVCLELERK